MTDFHLTPPDEIFKPIPGYPGYEISNYGKVRSYWRIIPGGKQSGDWAIVDTPQKILRGSMSKDGYPQVTLSGKITRKIHKLVLLAFVGPPPPGHESCHKDGIRTRCFLSNLYYGTHRQNVLDRIKHGNGPQCQWKGEKHPGAKLTDEQAIEIRKMYATHNYSQRQLAKNFGVSQSVINDIILRKKWVHLP